MKMLLENKSASLEPLENEPFEMETPARNKFPKIKNKSFFMNRESIELETNKK